MQFPIDNILIVPSKNHFMNEIGDFVTVYTQIPRSNLNAQFMSNTVKTTCIHSPFRHRRGVQILESGPRRT